MDSTSGPHCTKGDGNEPAKSLVLLLPVRVKERGRKRGQREEEESSLYLGPLWSHCRRFLFLSTFWGARVNEQRGEGREGGKIEPCIRLAMLAKFSQFIASSYFF